jgi:hypothetical protein
VSGDISIWVVRVVWNKKTKSIGVSFYNTGHFLGVTHIKALDTLMQLFVIQTINVDKK